MKDLPIVAKSVINIVLYILYVLLASIIFSFLFPLIMRVLWLGVLDASNPVFVKIQIFIAILVLLISLILRKYFYICSEQREVLVVEKNNYTAKKKPVNKKNTAKTVKKSEALDEDEDEIKIYVEKEIK